MQVCLHACVWWYVDPCPCVVVPSCLPAYLPYVHNTVKNYGVCSGIRNVNVLIALVGQLLQILRRSEADVICLQAGRTCGLVPKKRIPI